MRDTAALRPALTIVELGCTFRPRLARGVPRPKCGAEAEPGSDRCHAHRRIRDWLANLDDAAIWRALGREQRASAHKEKSAMLDALPTPPAVQAWLQAKKKREEVEADLARAERDLDRATSALDPAREAERKAWEAVLRLGPAYVSNITGIEAKNA